VTLLNSRAGDRKTDGSLPSWKALFEQYGLFRPSISELRLYLTSNIEGAFVSGTMQYGGDPNTITFTIDEDTLPANTLMPVDYVIDPLTTYPGQVLPTPVTGARYLLINDVGSTTVAWGSLTASANDIIEYNGSQWVVEFSASLTSDPQFVLNLNTNRQFRWSGIEWVMSIDNYFGPGFWRISL
jgi:hypothetical protein